MIAAVLITLLSVFSMAQIAQVTVPLASLTQNSEPVQLTGTITALDDSATGQYEYRQSIAARNMSQKDVCLLALETTAKGLIRSPYLHTGIHDYFFTPRLLAANAQGKIESHFAPQGRLEGKVTPTTAPPGAVANLKLLFVQFSDGSTWGDAAVAAQALQDRRTGFEAMKSLLATYQLRGEKEFITALLRQPSVTVVEVLRHTYHPDKNNVDEVLQKLATGLRNAQQHQGCLQAASE